MSRTFWEAQDPAPTLMQQLPGLGMELWGCRQGLKCPRHEGKGWDGEALPALQARSMGATRETQPPRPAFPTGKVNPSTSWQGVGCPGSCGGAGQWMPFCSPERLFSSSQTRVCSQGVINLLSLSCSPCVFCYPKHYTSESS